MKKLLWLIGEFSSFQKCSKSDFVVDEVHVKKSKVDCNVEEIRHGFQVWLWHGMRFRSAARLFCSTAATSTLFKGAAEVFGRLVIGLWDVQSDTGKWSHSHEYRRGTEPKSFFPPSLYRLLGLVESCARESREALHSRLDRRRISLKHRLSHLRTHHNIYAHPLSSPA